MSAAMGSCKLLRIGQILTHSQAMRNLPKITSSSFSTTCSYCAVVKNLAHKKSDRMLGKMLQKSAMSKRKWYIKPGMLVEDLDLTKSKSRNPKVSDGQFRRSRHLSVILHEYISSMVTAGEVDKEVAEQNVEITKVALPPDLGSINVHWLASGSYKDEDIQALLQKNAGKLRSALMSLHIVGHIPPINFVLDTSKAKYQEVLRLLETADLGPDHETMPIGDELRNSEDGERTEYNAEEQSLSVQSNGFLEKEAKETGPLVSDKDCTSEVSDALTDSLPKSDILDVDRDTLMEQVIKSKRRAKDRFHYAGEDEADSLKLNIKGDDYSSKLKQVMRNRKMGKFTKRRIEDEIYSTESVNFDEAEENHDEEEIEDVYDSPHTFDDYRYKP